MTLIDSSVWIDYFRGNSTLQTEALHELLGAEPVAAGDLVLTEVLQGFGLQRDYEQAKALLTSLHVVELGGESIAIAAADNYRFLRTRGITIRKTIDTIIATRCIREGYALLYNDRDFDPFVQHLGLRTALLPH